MYSEYTIYALNQNSLITSGTQDDGGKTMEEKTRFRIEFDHYEGPGCGCGCFDNDLNESEAYHNTHFLFGTRNEANELVKDLERNARFPYWNNITLIEEPQRKYVLTGPPCSGKSTIIQALEKRGEYVVNEAASEYIRKRQSENIKEPWREKDFQQRILELQLEWEGKIPIEPRRVFLDRSVYDGLAYLNESDETHKHIMKYASGKRYDKIFYVNLLNAFETTTTRRENRTDAEALGEKLKGIYRSLGYEITEIKSGSIEERINIILENTK